MSQWFNDDQVDHMKSLGSIPREKRCASGWHVSDPKHPMYERCDCKPCTTPAGSQASSESGHTPGRGEPASGRRAPDGGGNG